MVPSLTWDDISPTCAIEHHVKKRINYQIGKNLDLIRDKKVLDLAMSWGHFTYPMLYAGATHVTATDIRSSNITAVVAALQHVWPTDNVDIELHDINRHELFADWYSHADTIHLSGIIYHISNHFDLLRALSKLPASAIIIDTIVPHRKVYFDPTSTMTWYTEQQSDQLAGIDCMLPNVNYAGFPNQRWLYDVLSLFGWHVRSHDLLTILHPHDKLQFRAVITAVR